MNQLLKTVKQTIITYEMFQKGDSVLVGVSGGPDSVALLYLLAEFASEFALNLGVAHLNHALRGKDSDQDAEFVKALAKKLNLPYYIKKENVREYQHTYKLSLEEAARHVRYAFFETVAKREKFHKIATGHHADDNAELVLMYLLRGSGTVGISGIPPVRDFKFLISDFRLSVKNHSLKIIRPLIRVSRNEILDFVTQKGVSYVSDKSNRDTRFLRNRIRHSLIPDLKRSYNPKITETLNRLSAIIQSEEKWLEDIITPLFKDAILALEDKKISLSVQKINQLHTAAKRRIIRKAIASIKGNLRRIGYTHTDTVITLLSRNPPSGELDLPDHIKVACNAEKLVISYRQRSGGIKCQNFEYIMSEPGMLFIKELDIYLKFEIIYNKEKSPLFTRIKNHEYEFFDMDKLSFPLFIRNIRPGDRFTPLGMTGTQKIKKYFINNKIPASQRVTCPVILSQGKIIWVVGHRIAESVKITPETQNILKVRIVQECKDETK